MAAAVPLVAYTLVKVIPKWWASREAATEARFQAIQQDNATLITTARLAPFKESMDNIRDEHRGADRGGPDATFSDSSPAPGGGG